MTPRSLRIAKELQLPLDTVTSTVVVYGGKGMGKTNFGSVLVEEMTKADLRWSVLDPLGVWWGLRHSADGKGPGIECLILGGQHGDIPIEPTAGGVVADLVIEEQGTNVVVDFSRKPSGEMWSIGEKVRFVTAYALRLFQRQGELREGRRHPPMMQILDEAARYIPQMTPHGNPELAKSVGAWEQITEEGRNIGLGVTFLTQRSARMAKSVSELADAMIAFRIVGPRSIEAVTDWLGAHVERKRSNEIVEQVRRLPVGEALVISPGWLAVEAVVKMRMRETFDSSKTPKPGEQRRQPKQAAKPDLGKYRERMAATIEKAIADDPRELRRRITELERDLRKAKPGAPPPAAAGGKADPELRKQVAILTKERAALQAGLEELMKFVVNISAQDFLAKAGESIDQEALQRAIGAAAQEAIRQIDRDLGSRRSQFDQVRREAQRLVTRLKRLTELADIDEVKLDLRVRPQAPFAVTPARPAPRATTSSNGTPPGGVTQRILDALAELEALGSEAPAKELVALLAGYTNLASKGFANAIGAARTDGLIDYPAGGRVALTDEGRHKAATVTAPRSSAEIQERIFGILGGASERILRPLVDAYPEAIDKVELAAQAGYGNLASKGFANAIGRLRSLGFIAYPQKGLVCAEPVLFLEGR